MTYSTNPYVLQFGVEPNQFIPRKDETQKIENSFFTEGISQQCFMITGVRGSGKTVFMTNLAEKCKDLGWFVINLNISSDLSLFQQIVDSFEQQEILHIHDGINTIGINVMGIGAQVTKSSKTISAEFRVKQLFKQAEKKNLKILITIDEVINTDFMKAFAGAFQIWIREKLPVYLLMTGLYENIRKLQDDKTLTFLYRCPRIDLGPLSMQAIQSNYKNILNVNNTVAIEMTKLTKGYSFAFQVLGYIVWEHKSLNQDTLDEYKNTLASLSYEKIWDELSNNDRKLCTAIAQSNNGSIEEIKNIMNCTNSQLAPYRKRLIEKQIVTGKRRGYLTFTLPLFEEFVLDANEYDFW